MSTVAVAADDDVCHNGEDDDGDERRARAGILAERDEQAADGLDEHVAPGHGAVAAEEAARRERA